MNITIFGGGNGAANTINALKNVPDLDLSAVIATSDSGGSSGELRKKFKCLPPGDIMRAILAMSKYDYEFLKEIFYKIRFKDVGNLSGHNLGNLFLILSEQYNGNTFESIRALEQAVSASGHVYPNSLDKTDLVAELENGNIIEGEHNIDEPNYGRDIKIDKLYLEPEVKIYEGAREVIENSDYIILGSGSFYTSVVSSVLPLGTKEAIAKSGAKIIFICGNAYGLDKETGPETVSELVENMEKYLPGKIDYIVYNDHMLTENEKKQYYDLCWKQFRLDEENLSGYNLIKQDLEANKNEGVGTSYLKLGQALSSIIYGN